MVISKNVGQPLLLLLATQRSNLIFQDEKRNDIRKAGAMFDKCSQVFLQVGEAEGRESLA